MNKKISKKNHDTINTKTTNTKYTKDIHIIIYNYNKKQHTTPETIQYKTQ